MRQINRNPFARTTLVRYQVRPNHGHGDTCANCGSLNRQGKLYVYGIDPDSIQNILSIDSKAFCSIGCRRSYYGE